MSFKKFTDIFFDRDPDARIDLFKVFPGLYRVFERRRFHALCRTIGDIIFTFIILGGLFGPQDPDRNCILFLAWGVWWPTVVLSWFFVGRMWCGFCPFPGLGRVFQKMGITWHRPVPRILTKYGTYWSVSLLAFIIWIEESTGMKESPLGTALLLLAILGGAALCAVLFPKQAWCRYLCPMGRLTGVASTLSMIEFRPDHDKCRQCKTFACKRGNENEPGCPVYLGAFNVRNNLDCLVCGHCLKLCPYDAPQLNFRNPFRELIVNKGRFITCSYIIPFLMGSQLARFYEEGTGSILSACTHSFVCHMGLYSLLLLVGFLYVYGVNRVGALLFGMTEDELFGKFSPMVPIFLPLAFAGELAYRLNYTLETAPGFFPVVGRQFGLPSLESWTFTVPAWVYPAIDLPVMLIATVAALYVLYMFVYSEFEDLVAAWRYHLIQGIVFFMLATYLTFMSMNWHGIML